MSNRCLKMFFFFFLNNVAQTSLIWIYKGEGRGEESHVCWQGRFGKFGIKTEAVSQSSMTFVSSPFPAKCAHLQRE